MTNTCRLYSSDGHALIDLMMRPDEEPPEVGKRVLCRHPFEESKRAYVMPHKVEPLYKVRRNLTYVHLTSIVYINTHINIYYYQNSFDLECSIQNSH